MSISSWNPVYLHPTDTRDIGFLERQFQSSHLIS